jgi:TonB family protein
MSQNGNSSPDMTMQQRFTKAHSLAESGDYRAALKTIRDAKSIEPRNIYILAFEKQVEQLAELAEMHLLSNEQRSDILESIPGIIERALEGSKEQAGAAPQGDTRVEVDKEKEERVAALEWLKNQYFQHAHEYVRKGEYQHALAEIRRVYIIDPNNKIAKDFEKQIDQLIALRQSQATPRTQTAPSAYPEGQQARTGAAADGATGAAAQAPRLHALGEGTGEQKVKKPINFTIVAAIILTLIAVAIAGFYFFKRQKQLKAPAPTEQSISSAGTAASSEIPEQNFLLSQSEGGGSVSTQATPEGGTAATASPPREENFSPPGLALANDQPDAQGAGRTGASEVSPSATDPPSATTTLPGTKQGEASLAGGGASAVETLVEDARILRLERPRLPEGIYASGLEGQVVVQVDIDRDGNPRQTKILRSTNDLLDPAVIDAINRSQFSPRKMSTGPVASSLTIPFTFRTKR